MDIRTTLTKGIWTLSPTGELDLASVDQFRRAVRRLTSAEVPYLLFDFTELSYIDGRGIGLIYETVGRLPEEGWLGIVNPDARVLRILECCGASRLNGCRFFFSWEDAREACIRTARATTLLTAQA